MPQKARHSDNYKIGVCYAFVTRQHINEELAAVKKMIKDCKFADYILLSSIEAQLKEALRAMDAMMFDSIVLNRTNTL